MIGNRGSQDLALGFTFRTYNDLADNEKLYVSRFKTAIDAFPDQMKPAIKKFKLDQTGAKAALEKEKNERSGPPRKQPRNTVLTLRKRRRGSLFMIFYLGRETTRTTAT
jgi:hypothetical protein